MTPSIRIIFLGCCLIFQQSYAQNWESFGSPNWFPLCLYADSSSNVLYVGGGFQAINELPIKGLAMWNGSEWKNVGKGIDYDLIGLGDVLTIKQYKSQIIVGGAFRNAGGVDSTRYLARWDGTKWLGFNGEPNSPIEDLLVYNNRLYVCGGFDSLGDVPANGVGMWDGENWHAVGHLPDYDPSPQSGVMVYAMEAYNDNLYISGSIEDSSHLFHHHLAWFDGSQWHYFDEDLQGALAGGWDLEVYNNELYVAGYFSTQDGNYGNCIQRWNGSSWNGVGGGAGGVNNNIWKLKVWNGLLYAGGSFTEMGDISAQKIARWDGSKWCGLGSEFDGDINAIEFYQDTLHVAGGFSVIDGDSILRLAKWIGSDYIDTCSSPVGISEINEQNFSFSVFPNPVTNQITIFISDAIHPGVLTITNALGEILLREIILKREVVVDVSSLPSGIYFITINAQGENVIKKFMKE